MPTPAAPKPYCPPTFSPSVPAIHGEKMTKRSESGDVLDVAGMQQLVDHVKNQQRLHPVVGKTFPSLGECDVAEPARMSEKGAILGLMHGRRVLRRVRFGKLFGNVIPSGVENGAAGEPRHGREGRRLSEREVSESNL